jgi:ABC-2 type transport system permease protein
LIVFGVVFGILGAALVLVRETSSGTLQRMRLAQVRSIDILGGLALALAALTTVQLFLSYALAALFHFQTGGALFLALGICLVLSLGCSGLGMATAGLTHSEGDATNLATGLLVPMVFLSGAIFPMPAAPLFSLAGQTISAYDLMPSTHAAEAMRRVLVYGDGPAQIAYSLAGLALTSSLYLALGAWLYQKRRIHS